MGRASDLVMNQAYCYSVYLDGVATYRVFCLFIQDSVDGFVYSGISVMLFDSLKAPRYCNTLSLSSPQSLINHRSLTEFVWFRDDPLID